MKKYTSTHEWVEIKEGVARIGITEFASREIGEVVYIELPKVGSFLAAGEEVAILESTKAATDLYSPLKGEIQRVNTQLQKNLEWLWESPEDKGWLWEMKLDAQGNQEALMDESSYRQLCL